MAAEEEIRKFKLLGTASALVAILALIAALWLQMQNSSLSASIARLESEKGALASQNAALQAQLDEARASAGACAGASRLTALLPLLMQSGMLGNMTGVPGLPGGVLPGIAGLPLGAGNLTGMPGLTPEMMQSILEAMRNATNRSATQYP
ncbi:MAG: hypothetical protein QXH27_03960 [Candidatus Micrarchaeia archaeon]